MEYAFIQLLSLAGPKRVFFPLELRHQLHERFTLSTFFDAGVVHQYKNLYPGWQGQTNVNNTHSLMVAGFRVKWDYEG
jgi:hemolysin activation/secretion protein